MQKTLFCAEQPSNITTYCQNLTLDRFKRFWRWPRPTSLSAPGLIIHWDSTKPPAGQVREWRDFVAPREKKQILEEALDQGDKWVPSWWFDSQHHSQKSWFGKFLSPSVSSVDGYSECLHTPLFLSLFNPLRQAARSRTITLKYFIQALRGHFPLKAGELFGCFQD